MPVHHADGSVFAAVSQLLAEYHEAVDVADLDAILAIVGEAVLVPPGAASVSGLEALRSAYQKMGAAPRSDEKDPVRRTKHHFTNLRIDQDRAEGAFVAHCVYFVLVAGTDGPRVGTSGRYLLHVADGPEGWRIRRLEILRDLAD